MKFMSILAIIATLSGCHVLEQVAPKTMSGFKANGILGALDGASGAVIAKCEVVDGAVVRVAIDDLGDRFGAGDIVERAAAARAKACALAGGVQAITNAAK